MYRTTVLDTHCAYAHAHLANVDIEGVVRSVDDSGVNEL